MSARVPVLIVGGGPVGLALAGELGWRGIACTLIEQSDGSIEQPKMDLVGIRTMEFCRRWGILDWVHDAPYPLDYPQDYIYVTGLNGYELGREPFPGRGFEPCPPESPQKRERVPQDMFDPILRRFAERSGLATLRYNCELVSFSETPDGVMARIRNTLTGAEETIEADYMAGTDGGASTVREQLGIGMTGNPALTYTTNVMFRCADFARLHDKGLGYRFIFIGPDGVWLTIVAVNGRDRFRMSIVGSPQKINHGEDDIRAALRRAMGRDFDYDIMSVMRWVRHELVADRYGTERIFIAGDAAHLMSPTGGFGMNTGIGDAVDLGWKLEAAIKGWGGPSLLSTYEAERRPVGLRNVAEASRNLKRMLSTRERLPGPEIFADGPESDAARKDYGDWFAAIMRHEWFANGVMMGYRYDHSPIVFPDGTPAPPDLSHPYVQTARPGARAPHVWIGESRSTLDLFGRGFVLLKLGRASPSTTGIETAARARGVPLTVHPFADEKAMAAYERALVLVRPDGHVAWRADAEPADAGALIDTVRGQTGQARQQKLGSQR
ncbi:MAG: FAD-dependent oxidoreductase [Xanthobacteraceae bacterium]|nr:FAD-dependent oxidoreductase [Xanthobacteraceae bacterium]